jgi:hypothetical protein
VILVGGATMTRQGNAPLAEALASDFTVINYDRRGRAGSGDSLPYALEREFEDIDALITGAGGSAHLYGISSGGALALEAAAAGLAIDRLAVYEVPYGLSDDQPRQQAEYVANLERAADQGPGARMEVFLRVVGTDDDAVAATRNSDAWPGLVAVEHTLAYDAASMGTGQPPAGRPSREDHRADARVDGCARGRARGGKRRVLRRRRAGDRGRNSVGGASPDSRSDPRGRPAGARTRAFSLLQRLTCVTSRGLGCRARASG